MILAVTPRQASTVADAGISTSNIFVSICPGGRRLAQTRQGGGA